MKPVRIIAMLIVAACLAGCSSLKAPTPPPVVIVVLPGGQLGAADSVALPIVPKR